MLSVSMVPAKQEDDEHADADEEIHHYGITYHRCHAYREQSGIFLMEHLAPEQAEEASGEEYIR